jgi:hypothetical protein
VHVPRHVVDAAELVDDICAFYRELYRPRRSAVLGASFSEGEVEDSAQFGRGNVAEYNDGVLQSLYGRRALIDPGEFKLHEQSERKP